MSRRTIGWVMRAVAVLVPVVAVVVIVASTREEAARSTQATDVRNGRVFIQDNLWSTETEQYAVWVAPDGTPFAGKRARGGGAWRIENLGALPGNPLAAPTENDEHNVYAIAVDGRGYVHVIGNMHNGPLRYIRSRRPRDLASWETGRLAEPATSVTYPRLVALPDGTLLFWRRESTSGAGVILLDALGPGADQWEHIGAVLDGTTTGEIPYVHDVAVDPRSGVIHLMFEWRAGRDVATTNDVGYARSGDGGRSWETSARRELALPITHRTAEVVLDTPPSGSGLVNDGGLTVAADGRPHGAVVLDRTGGRRTIVHLWRGRAGWRREDLDGSTVGWRPGIAGTRDGKVWLLGAQDDHLVAVDVTNGAAGAQRTFGSVPRRWEVSYDTQALARHGRVEILVPEGRRPLVVTAPI